MRILSIETSCDETAVSLVEATGDFPHATYEVLGNALWSQIDAHREFGGVMPSVGKREHIKVITSLLQKVVEEAEIEPVPEEALSSDAEQTIQDILTREEGLADAVLAFHAEYGRLEVDRIAVTTGPGLEPALWVGVNFAKALATLWDVTVVPTNHMEGHILASIFDADRDDMLSDIQFPALSLLISGGHTEFILMNDWGHYEKIGQTVDDAVGEAFDKVARLLGLPYPGGPEISKQAAIARKNKLPEFHSLPVPMIGSGDLNFSFSGLKTAVRYAVQDKVNAEGREDALGYKELSEDNIAAIARDFEDVVAKVLIKKTQTAADLHNIKTVVVGGGVSANRHIREQMNAALLESNPDVTVYFPPPGLSTDNSLMIALAGHAHAASAITPTAARGLTAEGNKKHRQIPLGEQIV